MSSCNSSKGCSQPHLTHTLLQMRSKSSSHDRTTTIHTVDNIICNCWMWTPKHIDCMFSTSFWPANIDLSNGCSGLSWQLGFFFFLIVKPVVKSEPGPPVRFSCNINDQRVQQTCKYILCLLQKTRYYRIILDNLEKIWPEIKQTKNMWAPRYIEICKGKVNPHMLHTFRLRIW